MALKQTAVLYHYPCPDGAFAALAAHLYFSSASPPPLFFPNTVYSPIKVEELPVDQIGDAYLLDFVGPPGFVNQLSSKVQSVIILDHHKTALKMLEDGEFGGANVTKIIDMGRSGATIAYDYFKEKTLLSHDNENTLSKFECSRRLFEYIEDADLWRWRLQNSKAFSSGLKDLNIEFDANLNPSLFQQLLSLDVEHVINQGLSSLSQKQTLINEVLDQSYEIVLDDGSSGHCLAVNADSVSHLRSELGHQLAEKSRNQNLRGISAVVYRVPELEDDQILKISLRSIDNEDTTSISQKHGGGGHRNASSFMLSCKEFEQWKAVNADFVSHLRSELGHQLTEKSRNQNLRGIGAVVYIVPELEDDQILKVSLRSIDNEDTTSISQKNGGGGLQNATSFMLSCQEFEQWKVGCTIGA